jgi:hypothetical protein
MWKKNPFILNLVGISLIAGLNWETPAEAGHGKKKYRGMSSRRISVILDRALPPMTFADFQSFPAWIAKGDSLLNFTPIAEAFDRLTLMEKFSRMVFATTDLPHRDAFYRERIFNDLLQSAFEFSHHYPELPDVNGHLAAQVRNFRISHRLLRKLTGLRKNEVQSGLKNKTFLLISSSLGVALPSEEEDDFEIGEERKSDDRHAYPWLQLCRYLERSTDTPHLVIFGLLKNRYFEMMQKYRDKVGTTEWTEEDHRQLEFLRRFIFNIHPDGSRSG